MSKKTELYILIKNKGYTIESFADSLGFTKQNFHHHLKNLENGKLTFTGETLVKIKQKLGINLLDKFF